MKNIRDENNLMHRFEETRESVPKNLIVVLVLIVMAGVISGYGLTYINKAVTPPKGEEENKKIVVGSADKKTFRDQAEGILELGGINGEGTHRLIRSGGESQTVYLTSSVLNLNDFVGKKVRVWGETNAGQKAGWLMDVGRVETIN